MKGIEKSLFDRLSGRRVVASVSGGKDSAAMSLYLKELGVEHDRIFCDTGWEHPLTYAYVLKRNDAVAAIAKLYPWTEKQTCDFLDNFESRYDGEAPLQQKLGPITVVRGEHGMPELIRKKGIFPSRVIRYCTQELKVFPLKKALNAYSGETINAVGIRRGESLARAQMPEWEWSAGFDCETWRPLVNWLEQDVIDIHLRHSVKPNPLYLLGATRVGCWPCIFVRKEEMRLLAEIDAERVELMRTLEAEISARAGVLRGFFHARVGGKGVWPVDKVVDWSRTPTRGRTHVSNGELFAAGAAEAGCMRWGLCETDAQP